MELKVTADTCAIRVMSGVNQDVYIRTFRKE
jgi:hypothetical protein